MRVLFLLASSDRVSACWRLLYMQQALWAIREEIFNLSENKDNTVILDRNVYLNTQDNNNKVTEKSLS